MESITVLVQYKIKKKKIDKATNAISEYLDAVKNEVGTTEYKIFQDKNDSALFIHLMSFVDKNARKAHEKSEHLKKLKKILVPISKGKAVYTTIIPINSASVPKIASATEIKKDASSHEPL